MKVDAKGTCAECLSAVFEPMWGEIKCKEYTHTIHDISDGFDCPKFARNYSGIVALSEDTPLDYMPEDPDWEDK